MTAEKKRAGRPLMEREPLTWRAEIRLPAKLGKEIERLAVSEGTKVATLLRRFVKMCMEDAKCQTRP